MDRTGSDTAGARDPRAKPSVWRAVLLLGSSVALLGISSWVLVRRPHADVGTIPSAAPSSAGAAEARFDPTAPALPTIRVHSARLVDQHSARPAPAPVRVRIPAAGVDATVIPVGVDFSTGTVQVPTDVRRVGWYRFGPSPGQSGSAALLGHVDSAAQGLGAFFQLQQIQPGALIFIQFQNRSTSTFRVVARRSYPKVALPARVFSRSGPPLLTLITCGGAFDPVARHYADNVVVYAVQT